jgi:hypothetical protein
MGTFTIRNRKKVGKWILMLLRDHWGSDGLLVVPFIGRGNVQKFAFVRPCEGDSSDWCVLGLLTLRDERASILVRQMEHDIDGFASRELRSHDVVPWLAEVVGLARPHPMAMPVEPFLERHSIDRQRYLACWNVLGFLLRDRPELALGALAEGPPPEALTIPIGSMTVRIDEYVVSSDFARLRLSEHGTTGLLSERLGLSGHSRHPLARSGTAPTVFASPIRTNWIAFDPDDSHVLFHGSNDGLWRTSLRTSTATKLADSDGCRAATIWGSGPSKWLVADEAVWNLTADEPAFVQADLSGEELSASYGARSIGVVASAKRLLQVRRGRVELLDYPPPLALRSTHLQPTRTLDARANATLGLSSRCSDWVLASTGAHHQVGTKDRDALVDETSPDGHPSSVAVAQCTGMAAVFSRRIHILDVEAGRLVQTFSLNSKHKVAGAFSRDDRYLVLLVGHKLVAMRPASGVGWVLGLWPATDDPVVTFSADGDHLAVAGEELVVLDWRRIEAYIPSQPMVEFERVPPGVF